MNGSSKMNPRWLLVAIATYRRSAVYSAPVHIHDDGIFLNRSLIVPPPLQESEATSNSAMEPRIRPRSSGMPWLTGDAVEACMQSMEHNERRISARVSKCVPLVPGWWQFADSKHV